MTFVFDLNRQKNLLEIIQSIKQCAHFKAYQLISPLVGLSPKTKSHEKDYVGINGETSWILVSDHFSRFLVGDTRLSKASPLD